MFQLKYGETAARGSRLARIEWNQKSSVIPEWYRVSRGVVVVVAVAVTLHLSPFTLHRLYALAPNFIAKQGQIRVAGQPVTGAHKMHFRLYTSPSAPVSGTAWEQVIDNPPGVYFINGMFNYPLTNGINNLDFSANTYYMSMAIDNGNEMLPREPLAALPYAFAASTATCLRGNGHIRITGAGPHYIYTDNFGIGTQTPDQKLTVEGNISQTGTIISSGTGNNYFAGNVGIGISNPVSKLQVLGGVLISSNSAVPGDTIVQVSTAVVNGTLLIVNGNGNVGIGKTNPIVKLDVNGGISTGGSVPVRIGTWGGGNWIISGGTVNDSANYNSMYFGMTDIFHYNSSYQQVHAFYNNGGIFAAGGITVNGNDIQIGINDCNLKIIGTDTSGSLILRPWKDGNYVMIADGNTDSAIKMYAAGSCFIQATAVGGGVSPLYLNNSGGGVYTPGNAWSISDRRFKKNIKPLTGALDKIIKLQGVEYEWINPQEHANINGLRAGFIAQDVEEVFPDWVRAEVDPNGKDKEFFKKNEKAKSISLSNDFDAYVVEAIKQLKAENDELKAEIIEIKKRIEYK